MERTRQAAAIDRVWKRHPGTLPSSAQPLHYEGERAGLGTEFLDEVEKNLGFVAEFSRAAVREGGSYRRLVVPRFPYYIVYRLVG